VGDDAAVKTRVRGTGLDLPDFLSPEIRGLTALYWRIYSSCVARSHPEGVVLHLLVIS
jgi:hypothetical protein